MNDVWPPNFSQFIPDLLVALLQFIPNLLLALFTGLAVGLALELVQRRSAAREQRQEAQRGWDRLQPRLRRLFVRPVVESLGTFAPQGELVAIAEALTGEPIRSWAPLLGKQHPIGLLVELDTQIGRLLGLGETLQSEVGQVTGKLRLELPVIEYQQGSAEQAVIVLVHHEISDLPLPEGFAEVRAYEAGLSVEALHAWAAGVAEDPRVARLKSPYMTALIRVQQSHLWLREHFDREDGAPPVQGPA